MFSVKSLAVAGFLVVSYGIPAQAASECDGMFVQYNALMTELFERGKKYNDSVDKEGEKPARCVAFFRQQLLLANKMNAIADSNKACFPPGTGAEAEMESNKRNTERKANILSRCEEELAAAEAQNPTSSRPNVSGGADANPNVAKPNVAAPTESPRVSDGIGSSGPDNSASNNSGYGCSDVTGTGSTVSHRADCENNRAQYTQQPQQQSSQRRAFRRSMPPSRIPSSYYPAPMFSIDPQVLYQRARQQCENGSDEDCIRNAKVRILMSDDPQMQQACGSAVDKTTCVDGVYGAKANSANLREQLRAKLNAAAAERKAEREPATIPAPIQPPTYSVPTPATLPDDDMQCLFMLARIRHGDFAYSRIEQVPPECRSMPELLQALTMAQRPGFSLAGSDTDREVARLTQPLTDEVESYRNRDNSVRDQMPPGLTCKADPNWNPAARCD
jgi:hypothetical protein